ncbi:hypothetical protein PLICRDRAFT_175061 [Plicaturopsis crispa FD-325 SS-3]|nr:hypothetical protein PLICRDRAFT_175061 [Plicaturopsis crispa FD-325 SS-3]
MWWAGLSTSFTVHDKHTPPHAKTHGGSLRGSAQIATLGRPTRARRLARCEPVHARRRRRNETPVGVSSSLPSAALLVTLSTNTGLPSRARCKPVHVRRRRRNETPAGVSSSSLHPTPPPSAILHPQQTTTVPPSRAPRHVTHVDTSTSIHPPPVPTCVLAQANITSTQAAHVCTHTVTVRTHTRAPSPHVHPHRRTRALCASRPLVTVPMPHARAETTRAVQGDDVGMGRETTRA